VEKANGSVKLDMKVLSPDVADIISHQRAMRQAYRPNIRQKTINEDNDSDTETAVDSLFDNEKFYEVQSETAGESEFEVGPEVRESINDFRKNFERVLTSLQVSKRPAMNKKTQNPSTALLKKLETEKQECYRKITEVLNRMKDIDCIIDEIWKRNSPNKH
jgi:SpoVK/Ycf46/Vps4 family AAA+-type ATPase